MSIFTALSNQLKNTIAPKVSATVSSSGGSFLNTLGSTLKKGVDVAAKTVLGSVNPVLGLIANNQKASEKVSTFVKDAMQATTRAGVNIAKGTEAVVNEGGTRTTKDKFLDNTTVPTGKVGKFLLGDKPFSFKLASEQTTNMLVDLGVNRTTAAKWSTPLVLIGSLADVVPEGGVAKNAGKEALELGLDIIAKSKKNTEIVDELVKSLRLGRKEAIEVAPRLVGAETRDEVQTIIREFADSKVIIPEPKQSGFARTVANSPRTAPEVAEGVKNLKYQPITNVETIAKADARIAASTDEALSYVKNAKDPDVDQVATGVQLIKKFQDEGNYQQAIDIINDLAPKMTKKGQEIQILSMYNRLSPEGVVRYASSVLDKAGLSEKMTPAVAEKLSTQAKKVASLADGSEEKIVETATMIKQINDLIPSTIGKKIGSIQTMFQLMNPKTIIRNIFGNAGFAGLENVTEAVATVFDSALAPFTKTRTKTLPQLGTQARGFLTGFKQGARDARLGIDTTAGVSTQFDLPSSVFKNGLAAKAEKTLNYVLKAPDRAFYQAAYDNSLATQLKAAKYKDISKVPAQILENMKEVAHYDGLYKTFQDDSSLAYLFTGIKKALNLGKDFGAGDFILKYPKTPANLISRGLAYSPAGFLKTVFEAAKPLVGKPFNQKKFVESLARATTGTGMLVGTGAILHKLGIITGKRDDNSNIQATQRREGLGAYKINVSALKRFVLSGFDPDNAKEQKGDKLAAYDWFQPQSIGIAMGANYDEGKGDVSTILGSLLSGIDTIAEQPLIQGVTRFLKTRNPSEGVQALIESIPSSFVPTIVNQIRQLTDDRARSTYDTSFSGRIKRSVLNRIPGASETLEPRVNVFGENQRTYEAGSNNFFNVFFNPAITTELKKSPEGSLVLDIFNETGDVSQAPKLAEKKLTINGEERVLTPQEYTTTQRFIGTYAKAMISNLTRDPNFMKLDPETQAQEISNILSDISSASKMVLFGNQVKKAPSQRTQLIIQDYMQSLQK